MLLCIYSLFYVVKYVFLADLQIISSKKSALLLSATNADASLSLINGTYSISTVSVYDLG